MFTSIPCIAFDNASGKISEGYQWIKNNQYIKFVSCKKDFIRALNELDLEKLYEYNNTDSIYYYEKMSDLIRESL